MAMPMIQMEMIIVLMMIVFDVDCMICDENEMLIRAAPPIILMRTMLVLLQKKLNVWT